jgi:hypothetical protein
VEGARPPARRVEGARPLAARGSVHGVRPRPSVSAGTGRVGLNSATDVSGGARFDDRHRGWGSIRQAQHPTQLGGAQQGVNRTICFVLLSFLSWRKGGGLPKRSSTGLGDGEQRASGERVAIPAFVRAREQKTAQRQSIGAPLSTRGG